MSSMKISRHHGRQEPKAKGLPAEVFGAPALRQVSPLEAEQNASQTPLTLRQANRLQIKTLQIRPLAQNS